MVTELSTYVTINSCINHKDLVTIRKQRKLVAYGIIVMIITQGHDPLHMYAGETITNPATSAIIQVCSELSMTCFVIARMSKENFFLKFHSYHQFDHIQTSIIITIIFFALMPGYVQELEC